MFNGAGGSPATVNDLLRLVAEHVGRRPVIARHLPAQSGDVQATHGSTDGASGALESEPEVSLDDGVRLRVVDQLGGGR